MLSLDLSLMDAYCGLTARCTHPGRMLASSIVQALAMRASWQRHGHVEPRQLRWTSLSCPGCTPGRDLSTRLCRWLQRRALASLRLAGARELGIEPGASHELLMCATLDDTSSVEAHLRARGTPCTWGG